MQIKASAVGQLHDSGSRKNLCDRSDRENCHLGINGLAGADIGDAVAFRQYHLSALDQDERRAWDILLLHPAGEHWINQLNQPISVDDWRIICRRASAA